MGEGGAGSIGDIGKRGTPSSFANLVASGGYPGSLEGGGNGGSGGASGAQDCKNNPVSGMAGLNGTNCDDGPGGNGQGIYAKYFPIFSKSEITFGQGGKCGSPEGFRYAAGGGAGGLLINGNGPTERSGNRYLNNEPGGKRGVGYGAGGGGGGNYQDFPRNVFSGGAGANGVVYLEYG